MHWTEKHVPSRSELLRTPGEYLHVYNRGVDRQTIFFGETYYLLFLDLLTKCLTLSDLRILAYCLMPNHFHFLIQQIKAYALSAFMESLSGEYARSVNIWRGRTGHLFQGRFKIKWVWQPEDISVLANYIHQNPKKGGLVTSPEEWPYSSCGEYFGLRPTQFVETKDVLTLLNGYADYRSFLYQSADAEALLPLRCRFRE